MGKKKLSVHKWSRVIYLPFLKRDNPYKNESRFLKRGNNSILYLCLNCQNMQLDKTVYLRKMYILLFLGKKNYGSVIFCKASFIFNWKNFNTLLVKKNYLYINEVELFISHSLVTRSGHACWCINVYNSHIRTSGYLIIHSQQNNLNFIFLI
jgi:hypothetical protein